MKNLTLNQLTAIEGGDTADLICGVTIGATVVASTFFGVAGFALTINKAIAACTIAALT